MMPHERMMIQAKGGPRPTQASAERRLTTLSVLSHAVVTKYGVDVATDDPVRLASDFVKFRLAWRKTHGPSPFDKLRFRALEDCVRVYRETTHSKEC